MDPISLISSGLGFIGNIFGGISEAKMRKKQLALQQEQIDFEKQQYNDKKNAARWKPGKELSLGVRFGVSPSLGVNNNEMRRMFSPRQQAYFNALFGTDADLQAAQQQMARVPVAPVRPRSTGQKFRDTRPNIGGPYQEP